MSIELILVIVVMLASKLGLNSKNSRIATSKDINREKQTKDKSDKPAGGQKFRTGKTLTQAETPDELLTKLRQRMQNSGLELHPEKTRIVCCDPKPRRNPNQHYEFDFLGFTFRRRGARRKGGGLFTGFLPAISNKAKKSIVRAFRSWNLQRCTSLSIDQIAKKINPQLRGWINYYGKFYPSEMNILWRILNKRLVRWFRSRSKRYRWHKTKAAKVLEQFKQRHSYLFAHWKMKKC